MESGTSGIAPSLRSDGEFVARTTVAANENYHESVVVSRAVGVSGRRLEGSLRAQQGFHLSPVTPVLEAVN